MPVEITARTSNRFGFTDSWTGVKIALVKRNMTKRKAVQAVVSEATKASKISESAENSLLSKARYLIKSEPHEFSIDMLKTCPEQTSIWDGIRNIQARNIMRTMKVGDVCYFYYSNAKKDTGIHAIVEVSREYYPDPNAMNPKHKYYDSKCKSEDKWSSVDIKWRETLERPILLSELKCLHADKSCKEIQNMLLFKQSRLSIQTISDVEAEFIAQYYQSR